jgi:protoheme IX farnesyltransferase
VIVTLLPTFLGFASAFYLCVAALLNLLFLMKAYQFLSSENKNQNAQRLFFASIIYLPLLLIVLLIDNAFLAI